MSTWLTAWRNRETRTSGVPVMELVVVAGIDAGRQFTLEGDEILLGRGQPDRGEPDSIRLEDKSISRRQAWIRRDGSRTTLTHIESASNPTLLNGQKIDSAGLRVGDRIEMGRVAIDVRARDGMNLRGLTEIMEGAARESTHTARLPPLEAPKTDLRSPGSAVVDLAGEITEARLVEVALGELRLVRGADGIAAAAARSFPIGMGTTRIGRGEGVEVQIAELGVSRIHAEIGIDAGRIVLIQRSRTNPTLINGVPVLDRVPLSDGDEIQLADRVVLRVHLAQPERAAAGVALSRQMQAKIQLDRSIEAFNVMGTFLDVDVVDSRGMKGHGARPEHIIVSFERFRAYVAGICEEWSGQVLNSNGDELMCFFESATSAVLAGSTILERLAEFNRDQNLLSRDFRFRLGAHTGLSLVDLDAGVAYSEVLDTAGHIQKRAEPDSLVLSQTTLDSLSRPVPVTPIGELTGDPHGDPSGKSGSASLYRLDRWIRRADLETGDREPDSGC